MLPKNTGDSPNPQGEEERSRDDVNANGNGQISLNLAQNDRLKINPVDPGSNKKSKVRMLMGGNRNVCESDISVRDLPPRRPKTELPQIVSTKSIKRASKMPPRPFTWKPDAEVPEAPQELFPEEIWESIFFHVSHPLDLYRVSNVCQTFDRILQPIRDILLIEATLPALLKFIDGGDLLTFRRLCKGAKKMVDNFMENNYTNRPYPDEGLAMDLPLLEDPLSYKKMQGFVIAPVVETLRKIEMILRQNNENPDKTSKFLPGKVLTITDRTFLTVVEEDGRDYESGEEVEEDDNDNNDIMQAIRLHRQAPNLGRRRRLPEMFRRPIHGPLEQIMAVVRNQRRGVRGPWTDNRENRLQKATRRFLKIYGKGLLHLISLQKTPPKKGFAMVLDTFIDEVLKRTPAIRKLEIIGELRAPLLGLYDQYTPVDLPNLPNLESLCIDKAEFSSSCFQTLDNMMWKYHEKLRSFHVTFPIWSMYRGANWTFLRELIISEIDHADRIIYLQNTMSNFPRLRRFGLRFTDDYEGENSLKKLLVFLHSLTVHTSLEVLQIIGMIPCMSKDYSLSGRRPEHFAPAQIKTLELVDIRAEEIINTNFDEFIIRFPALKSIKFLIKEMLGFTGKLQAISSMQNQNDNTPRSSTTPHKRVYQSRIWTQLPKLDYYIFNDAVYTRKQFNHLRPSPTVPE